MHAFATAQNYVALMHNGTPNFCEDDLAPCVAECHHNNKGVQCQASDDVGKARRGREVGQIQCADVHGSHLVAVGQACDDGFVGKL